MEGSVCVALLIARFVENRIFSAPQYSSRACGYF
jgi:hypothetical protein